jgi:hypothetical protein
MLCRALTGSISSGVVIVTEMALPSAATLNDAMEERKMIEVKTTALNHWDDFFRELPLMLLSQLY